MYAHQNNIILSNKNTSEIWQCALTVDSENLETRRFFLFPQRRRRILLPVKNPQAA